MHIERVSDGNQTFKRLCVAIVIVGVLLRVFSIHWNQYVHGDVFLYAKASESVSRFGNFLIPTDISIPYWYSLKEKGWRFLEHNPLWPLIGGGVVSVFHISGYEALKALSLVAGILLLFFTYRFAFLLAGGSVALLTLLLTALSYPLIDYSGNGAFYIFQADLYLLFLILLQGSERIKNQIFLGAVLGFSFLLNQQTVILFVAYALYLFSRHRREPIIMLRLAAVPFFSAAILFLPWGIRNYLLFGSPFYSVGFSYLWDKVGALRVIQDGIISFFLTAADYLRLAKTSLLFWLPHNAYFIHRTLLVLAPVAYAGSLLLAVEMLFKKGREKIKAKIFLPAVFVLALHGFLSALFPDLKFRYLIPMLPIILAFGSFYIMEYIERRALRLMAIWLSIVFAGALSLITYYSTPTHTDYYGGTITTDIYNKNGENEFLNGYTDQELWTPSS